MRGVAYVRCLTLETAIGVKSSCGCFSNVYLSKNTNFTKFVLKSMNKMGCLYLESATARIYLMYIMTILPLSSLCFTVLARQILSLTETTLIS